MPWCIVMGGLFSSRAFSALVLAVFWGPLTTRGAQVSMLVGTASSLLLIYLSPAIQIAVLGNETAPFPLRNPGLVSIPLAFVAGIIVSLAKPEPEAAERFQAMQHRAHLGPAEGE